MSPTLRWIHLQFSLDDVFEEVRDTRKDAMLLRQLNLRPLPPDSLHMLGAYVAVALIVPGGSLIAFLWALRYRGGLTGHTWRTLLGIAALGLGLFFPG